MDYECTQEWLKKWGANISIFYDQDFLTVYRKDEDILADIIHQQIVQFESGTGKFSNKAKYLQVFTDPETREIDWFLFWSQMKRFAPELANLAVCLLSMGISEASVERSFSIQQLTHSKTRNRLNEDIVEAEMIIRFNKHVLNDADSLYDELSDDE